MFHLRQDGRREVDLILERRDGAVVAIEVKAAVSVDLSDARHLLWLRDQLPEQDYKAGIAKKEDAEQRFNNFDTNHDGFLSEEEFVKAGKP